jgi:hypothetical protein
MRWPPNATPMAAARGAYLECPHCGGVIEDSHKAEMNERGRYVAPGPKASAKALCGLEHG